MSCHGLLRIVLSPTNEILQNRSRDVQMSMDTKEIFHGTWEESILLHFLDSRKK
jgi:hypothetical protein